MPDYTRITTRFWNRLFRLTDSDEQPGPILSRNIQLVSVVSDDSHLLRPVFNPGAAAGVNVAAGGGALFTGIEIQAPAASAVVIHEVQNRGAVENIVINYTEPAGKVVTGQWQRLVTPGGAAFPTVMQECTFTANGAAGDFFVLAPDTILDELALVLNPGQSCFFVGNIANTLLEPTIALTQVG